MQLLEFSPKHLKGKDIIQKLSTDLPGHIMLDQADCLLYWYDWFFAWEVSGECDTIWLSRDFGHPVPQHFSLWAEKWGLNNGAVKRILAGPKSLKCNNPWFEIWWVVSNDCNTLVLISDSYCSMTFSDVMNGDTVYPQHVSNGKAASMGKQLTEVATS